VPVIDPQDLLRERDELRAERDQAREWSRQHHEMLEQALAEVERLNKLLKSVSQT
jgi:hypothetical protein